MEEYGGTYFYIPKMDKIERMEMNEQIKAEFDGYNFRELAQKFSLTEVSIRSIVSDKMREVRARPMDGQLSLL
ncbi:Mor transcription activator family protein [Acutalibacter muris]|uniref:Mor transcription activator family protein n=1 Tax=Acutalibacter muris TaxID=1796620 RepID=UPI00272BE9C8|nr:Mor transcription activator family protein [Acutalibacter muris]